MSRVSEAMRRAGYRQDEAVVSPSPSNDSPFVSAEDIAGVRADTAVVQADSEGSASDVRRPANTSYQAGIASRMVTEDIRIHDALRTLYRRRWLIAAVVSLSLAIAVAYNAWAPRIYEARARVVIEPTSDEVVPFRASGEDLGRSDYFVTQLEILRSQALARRTLQQAHMLSADPAGQLGQIGDFIGSVVVTTSQGQLGGSRVVSIAYRSGTPKLTAQMANGLAQAFVDQNLESRRQTSLAAAKWLNQRVDELRQEVGSTDGALQRYREQQNAASLDDRQNVVVQKFGQLNAAVTAARAERVEKETLYKQLGAR